MTKAASLYFRTAIKMLFFIGNILMATASFLLKVRLGLEVRAHNLERREGHVEPRQIAIPRVWFRCPQCGAVTDRRMNVCPAGCGEVLLGEVKLKPKHIEILLQSKKVWTFNPGIFWSLNKTKPTDEKKVGLFFTKFISQLPRFLRIFPACSGLNLITFFC